MLKEYKQALKSTGAKRDQLHTQNQGLQVNHTTIFYQYIG